MNRDEFSEAHNFQDLLFRTPKMFDLIHLNES